MYVWYVKYVKSIKLKISLCFSRESKNTPQELQPHQLRYLLLPETPKSSHGSIPQTPENPATPQSAVASPASSSSLTPSMKTMTIARQRGRPRKDLSEPNMEGFPESGSTEDKHKWLKMKAAELWRFNMLTSEQAGEYRQKENERVREYHRRKKAEAAGKAPPSGVDETVDQAKEKSRLWYVKKYIK